MQHPSNTKTWADDEDMLKSAEERLAASDQPEVDGITQGPSSSQRKKAKVDDPAKASNASNGIATSTTDQEHAQPEPMVIDRSGNEETPENEPDAPAASEAQAEPVSDSDWLRSKTSRLLGLLDEEEQADFDAKVEQKAASPAEAPVESNSGAVEEDVPQNKEETEQPSQVEHDANVEHIHNSARLFVRNLPYDTTEADLGPTFLPFGKIEEVSASIFLCFLLASPRSCSMMILPDRDIRCKST